MAAVRGRRGRQWDGDRRRHPVHRHGHVGQVGAHRHRVRDPVRHRGWHGLHGVSHDAPWKRRDDRAVGQLRLRVTRDGRGRILRARRGPRRAWRLAAGWSMVCGLEGLAEANQWAVLLAASSCGGPRQRLGGRRQRRCCWLLRRRGLPGADLLLGSRRPPPSAASPRPGSVGVLCRLAGNQHSRLQSPGPEGFRRCLAVPRVQRRLVASAARGKPGVLLVCARCALEGAPARAALPPRRSPEIHALGRKVMREPSGGCRAALRRLLVGSPPCAALPCWRSPVWNALLVSARLRPRPRNTECRRRLRVGLLQVAGSSQFH
mmetsp:Transcript_21620/g.51637  ORF Transcript_21620/g.51637 Transcript_21620/m.51637 type:complete len:319 (-) Transcript_21620:1461-2417(-)